MYCPFDKKFFWGLCNWMAILDMAAGCQSAPVMADSQPAPQAVTAATRQLIIKFKPNTLTCNAAGIAQLSSATRVPLEFIRPMSGDACVIKQLAVDTNDLLREQELLRQHSAVEWLEQDEKKRAL